MPTNLTALRELARDGLDDPDGKTCEKVARALLAALDVVEAADGAVSAVDALADESDGVAGLHLNGDMAPWPELRRGGAFSWLKDVDVCADALAKFKEATRA